ncbi:MAG: transketolase [Spirochaetales bacterium]|nr:transketolase [Spirochaetales bacterium]
MRTVGNEASWIGIAKCVARGIRYRVLFHTLEAGGGYLSQACSSAEILAVMYTKVMRLPAPGSPLLPGAFRGVPGPNNRDYTTGALYNGPRDAEHDRFILSPAHYALALYAALIETGRMHEAGLRDFNKDGSSVEMIGAEHSPGMEVMTGSLGQGISQAAGIALARKKKGESGKVWVFMSDGEFQIGQTWEAVEFAAYHGLTNIGMYVDVNSYQCDGKIDSVMGIDPLDRRLEAFGAEVVSCPGHDVVRLAAAASEWKGERPLVVLAQTVPWQGIEVLRQREPKFHYIRFHTDEERQSLADALQSYETEIERESG